MEEDQSTCTEGRPAWTPVWYDDLYLRQPWMTTATEHFLTKPYVDVNSWILSDEALRRCQTCLGQNKVSYQMRSLAWNVPSDYS